MAVLAVSKWALKGRAARSVRAVMVRAKQALWGMLAVELETVMVESGGGGGWRIGGEMLVGMRFGWRGCWERVGGW
jgi:hypothetical protein